MTSLHESRFSASTANTVVQVSRLNLGQNVMSVFDKSQFREERFLGKNDRRGAMRNGMHIAVPDSERPQK
ncbi:hypothetical protein [Pseudomonas sp. AKS31]|uniref:hypothetical protein n=1 Tax=Pseudomonas sp. AKS31 TaxID=2949091 RepID=UPI002029B735|nr:hypothetical protein [Pseudomonas sp. AKS31]MCL9800333.1 hypothetical protein [Pseudomonas sp. AKS31]